MKLSRAHVQNYRSIVDSGVVVIEDGVTVIIGKNEQGKTTFLKALASINPEISYSPNDLPNHLRHSLESKNAPDVPIVTLWFTIEPDDRKSRGKIIQNIDVRNQLKCTKYYAGNYAFWTVDAKEKELQIKFISADISGNVDNILQIVSDLQQKFSAHSERVPQFLESQPSASQMLEALIKSDFADPKNLDSAVSSFATALTGLSGQDQAIQDDIAHAISAMDAERKSIWTLIETQDLSVLIKHLPRVSFHSASAHRIPNEVKVEQFVAEPDQVSKCPARNELSDFNQL